MIYRKQRSGDAPHPMCVCGTVIDIRRVHPAVRDLADPDLDDAVVDQHFWYHWSIYRDWLSPHYRRDIAAEFARTSWTPQQQAVELDRKCALALHGGTYAAAVENMLRRMRNEDTSVQRYWLHQVEITLHPGDLDLDVDVHAELAELWGTCPGHGSPPAAHAPSATSTPRKPRGRSCWRSIPR